MKSFYNPIAIFRSLLCLSLTLQAADEVGKQVWIDVNPRWYSDDSIKISGQFGVQQSLNKREWTRYAVEPAFSYALIEGLNIGAGLGLRYTDSIDADAIVIPDHLAVVPFQDSNYVHHLAEKWKMNYRLRLEEKFDYNTQDWESINSIRLRLRIRTMYEFDAYQAGRYYRATLSWEGFTTMTGDDAHITERSRVTVGLERSYSHEQKGRIELTWQRQSLGLVAGDSFDDYSDIYLRLRYYPSWGNVLRNKFWHSD